MSTRDDRIIGDAASHLSARRGNTLAPPAFMRRALFAVLLPLLVVACASQPKKLSGRYALEVDPWLASYQSPYRSNLHERVTASLQQRLNLAASASDADAVIVLKRGATDADLAYEIRRRGAVVVSTQPTNAFIGRGDTRSIAENLEWQRRQDAARFGDPLRRYPENFRPSTANTDMAMLEAYRSQARHIAEMIVYDLRTKL